MRVEPEPVCKAQLVRSGQAGNYDSDSQLRALVDRVSMIYDDTAYRRYFEERVPAGVDFFGEITPSYAILSREGFKDARSQFATIRVILLLRDPVERHYSLMRMKERKGKIESAHESFIAMLDTPGPAERGQYRETIRNLEAVFRPDEVFIGFYEQLFLDDVLRKLCAFVGLPFVTGQYAERVNPGGAAGTSKPLTAGQIAAGKKQFADVYDFCRNRFGDAVPKSWHA